MNMMALFLGVQKGWNLAHRFHEGQFRKNTVNGIPVPYITHPIAVMVKLQNWGISSSLMFNAALCHDLLEDSPVTREELVVNIGEEATRLVEDLTFRFDKGNYIGPADQVEKHVTKKEAKNQYLQSFETKPLEALIVKIADRLVNTEDFLRASDKYAIDYMKSALFLFEIFMNRKQEIEVKFGESIFHVVLHEIIKIGDEVAEMEKTS